MPTRLAGLPPVLALLALAACSHAPPLGLSQPVRQGRCEDAASFLRAHPRGPPVESRLRQAVALPLSYALTGVGYTAEVALVVGGGIVVSGALCAPVLAIEVAGNGSGSASGECLGHVMGAFFADAELPGVGRAIHAATRGWRCADMTPVAEDLRSIAECYAWRAGPGDLERAREQLAVIRRSEDLLACVSDEERASLARSERWVEARLAERPAAAPSRIVP